MNSKETFKRLSCDSGCCLQKVKHLADQIFHEQDTMYNVLASENILLGNFVVDVIMPYLEFKAQHGDNEAADILLELTQLLRGIQ